MVQKKKITRQEQNKRNKKPPSTYGFPDVLRNRTAIAKTNLVWQIDATDLKVTLDNQPGIPHTLVAGVDPFSNKLLFTKVFYSGTRTNKFSSKNVIKILEETLKEQFLRSL